jgi:lycopene cyclase domain-containing protein
LNTLYLILDIITIFFPFVLSFDKKVAFYKTWPAVFPAILLIGIPFLIWDIIFTKMGVWGFNPDYLVGWELYNLPIEEVLFFIVVPYACTFIYACVKAYFPNIKPRGLNQIVYALIIIYALTIMTFGFGGWYSTVTGILAIALVLFLQRFKKQLYYLPLSFLIALVPFFIINGVLTGSGIEAPIVWYNDLENAGIRLFTIPMDDIAYAWVLLAGNIAVYEWRLKKMKQ